ncbi:Tim17-domain-containing protein [Metschnikowia bicuspidata]|uniref:Mitochondrial import inner membrane translocase subunit TIM23 n=1 Tax=Metschnikowia bicuspidata TaxID=27322 RepID=A0A4V1J2K6_9ASCO|nr:Tim17-domain-containing protein [Metschnikowia bicuspidata]
MSWLFSSNSEKPSKQSLGFDLAQVSDVSSIILAPGALDLSRLHPLAGLDKGIEYLDLEDDQLTDLENGLSIIAARNWRDNLCYGTGTMYLLGLAIGGAYGFQEGLGSLPANATAKLKLNTVLNHITKRGPFLGNSAGVLALIYNIFDSTTDHFRGKHDDINSLAAGALTGALFRSAAGVKPMAYSTAMMTAGAGAWCTLKRLLAD